MQDNILIYIDFINTMQNINQILELIIKSEINQKNITDITAQQLILLYQLYSDNYQTVKQKQYDKKHFYYTLQKFKKQEYINMKTEGKLILSVTLTDKGKKSVSLFEQLFEKQFKQLLFNGMSTTELSHVLTVIYRFEKFWLNCLNNKHKFNIE